MKTMYLLSFLLVVGFTSTAQQKVALNRNGTTQIYGGSDPFSDAYLAASAGDTIYLPGGNLPYPAVIDKSIVIIGAGHYPNATVATNRTVLNGNLSISENADNLHLEGIEITGTLSFNTNHKVDGVVVKRCKMNVIGYSGNGTTPCINNTIRECIINTNIDFSNAKSSLLSNNIIGGYIIHGIEIGISNNIFLYASYPPTFNNIDNSSISNNIVVQHNMNYLHTACELSTFSNNTFVGVPPVVSNTFTDNHNIVPIAGLFANQTGNAFDYTHDYHLVNPTTYLGLDGKQVGIYGGLFPFKESALPVNPNIVSKTIAPQTTAGGELNIQVQVKAQNN